MKANKKTRDEKVKLDEVVGRNIKRERNLRKLSRDELADILGLTTSHLGLIERGERGATGVTLDRLSRAMDISIDSLFSEKERATFASEKKDGIVVARKKIAALTSNFSEQELLFIAHVARGIASLHVAENGVESDLSDED